MKLLSFNFERVVIQEIDRLLIHRVLAGEDHAYDELMKRYRQSVYNLVYRMIENPQVTEDIVQETFIKAYNALSSFNEEFAFSTWLFKIATNHCIDTLRKKKLRTYSLDTPIQTKDGTVQRDYADDSYSPESFTIASEHTSIILDAVEDLPEKYKTVINMRHRDDNSYEEISETLQIPIGTVKARIFRAREILKRILKEKGYVHPIRQGSGK
ncbi:sigma-70 family RNA polymerase sigma factor [candidate division KSB1 bacterium]|nr:sigma-70 family RNA polymerase sigma factor [candidate division KSB1 bacterium]